MKFRKEAQGLFTDRLMGGEYHNKSGHVTDLNIPRSVMASARVDPEEVRRMMDEFEVWNQARNSGRPFAPGPEYATHPVNIAGLWMPVKELTRYPDDKLTRDIQKHSAKVNKSIRALVAVRQRYGLTNSIITSSGNPAVNPDQLNALIEQFQRQLDQLRSVSGPGQMQEQVEEAIQDCSSRIQILENVGEYLRAHDQLAREYTGGEIGGKPYVRIGSSAWLANPQLKWVFEQRAIGADRRARMLPQYLMMLQNPVGPNTPPDERQEPEEEQEPQVDPAVDPGPGTRRTPPPPPGPPPPGPPPPTPGQVVVPQQQSRYSIEEAVGRLNSLRQQTFK